MKNKLLAGLFFLFLSHLGYGQPIIVNVTPQTPSICSGAPVTLTATTSGGTAPYSYLWSTGETTSSISVNKALTYTVSVTDRLNNKGNAQVTVTAAVKPGAPTASNESGAVCPGSSARLVASAPGGVYQWYDANFNFKFTGPVYNTDAITQNTIFYVTTTIQGCTSSFASVPVTLIEKPVVAPVSVCSGSTATFVASGATTYQWYDDAGNPLPGSGATFTTGPLTASKIFFVTGTTNGCVSEKVEARADVKPVTPAPVVGGPYVVCFGSNVTLSVTFVNNVVFDWFDQATGGTPIISSPDFTTPILTANQTYYVQATKDGCPSERVKVEVTVNPPPTKPTVAAVAPVCYNTTATLSVNNPVAGVVYNWYTSATSAQVYRQGAVITTDALLSSQDFYVRAVTGGGACVSEPETVPVTVKSAIIAPSVAGATTICTGPATLTASATDGTIFKWYDTATSPTPLATSATFSPTVNADRSYFVSVTTSDGCESARTEVAISIMPAPAAPTATGGSTCIGGTAILTAAGGTNNVWYAQANGGTPLWSGRVFETPTLTNSTDYYVTSIGPNGCESITRTRVTATVIAKPARPTISGPGGPICAKTSTTLTASGSTGSYRWWSEEVGGDLLAETASYTTAKLSTTSTFWVEALTPEGCESDRRSITVNVTSAVNTQFLYSSATYCTTSPITTPTEFIPGTFSASPAGLNIRASDGRINPSTSLPGVYAVTFTPSGGACNTPTTTNIAITTLPDASFTYPQSNYCSDETNPGPNFLPDKTAGVFSASSPGLVFVNINSGQIDLAASTPGQYRVFNTITTDCGNSQAFFDITISQAAVVNAGANRSVVAGSSIQLAGNVNMGLGVTWTSSNAGDVFSNPNALNPTYTPAAANGSATLTLTTDKPSGVCGPGSDQVVISIVPKPNPPVVAPQTICYGDKATLSATGPGTIKWYDQPTGGAPVETGVNFITDALTADATFYASTTINGIESDRRSVLVTVRAQVVAPTVTGGGLVCLGAVPLAITETADAYRWYDGAGNLKSTSQNYTPTITQNTTFFAAIVINGCVSRRTRVDLTLKPTTTVNSAIKGAVCSGTPQNYTITAADASATFTYSRAAVAGISNTAVTDVSATQITEALINTTASEQTVVYVITPYLAGCPGPAFNYTVTVLPTPAITSANSKTIRFKGSVDYLVEITPDVASYFSWSRAAVPGISNTPVSGQESRNIREVLENTTNAPIDVQYVFSYGTVSCPGAPFTLTVTVNPELRVTSVDNIQVCSGEPVNYQITSNVNTPGVTFKWIRTTALPGQPAGTGTTESSIIDEVLFNNTTRNSPPVYYAIYPYLNGVIGTQFPLYVIVKPPVKKPEIDHNSPVCLGSEVKLFVKDAEVAPGTEYIWRSSAGLFQKSPDPILTVPATTIGRVSYNVTVVVNGCSNVSDDVFVEVQQTPVVVAGANQQFCPDVTRIPLNGQVNGGLNGGPIEGKWQIETGTGRFELSEDKKINAYLPSADDRAPGALPVVLSLRSASRTDCDQVSSVTFTFDRVKPTDTDADRVLGICSGGQVNYQIVTTGDAEPGITYSWVREAIGGNARRTGTSKPINETLINNTTADIVAIYTITPSLNGCDGTSFELKITVKPAIPKREFSFVQAVVCINKPIELVYPVTEANASYRWTGPDGIPITTTVPTLTLPNGISTPGLFPFNLTVIVGNCEIASDPQTIDIRPIPVVEAGTGGSVCPDGSPIALHGVVTRGVNGVPSTGIWRIVTGTGRFINAATQLENAYEPGAGERAGSVVLRLESTDACDAVTDEVTFTFEQFKAADAGADMDACNRAPFQLNGRILVASGTGTWKSSGDGNFNGQSTSTDLNAFYTPGTADKASGKVTLTLTADDNNPCNQIIDEIVVTLVPPPTISADVSPVRYVIQGRTITLNPIVSDENVTYLWTESPALGTLSNPTAKNPIVIGSGVDITYTLVVTNALGCPSDPATVLVKVSPPITTPNTITPNADGHNDVWVIGGVEAYPKMVVNIYDRSGYPVYHSVGYAKPWDGTNNGKPLPFGVYYFVIDSKEFEQKLSGNITLVR